MKAVALAMTAVLALLPGAVYSGVAPNSGASQMSQSGARIAPKKSVEESHHGQPDAQQEKSGN